MTDAVDVGRRIRLARWTFWRVMLLMAVVVAACTDSTGPSAMRVVDLTILDTSSQHAKLVQAILSSPAGIRVRFQATERAPLSVEIMDRKRVHEIPLARLRADATYHVEVLPLSDDFEADAAVVSFTTNPLPADLAELQFTAEGDLTAPLVLVEINNNQGGFRGVIAVDEEGQVVWHYRLAGVAGATRRDNGDIVLSSGEHGLYQVNPINGQTQHVPQRGPGGERFHHEVIATPWNTLYALATDTATIEGVRITGEGIWEWDPEAGTVEKRWSSFTHFSYAEHQGWGTHPEDWLHANALWIGPSGNIMVSLAFLDQVISLTPDFSSVEWVLGGPNATIPAEGDNFFHLQHTAAEIPSAAGRRIIMFDNGEAVRGYSRALELEIDPAAGIAQKVWEFRAPNDNWSPIVSLARRLENGNTFVSFGASPFIAQSHGPVEAYEVGADGNILWHMEITGYPEDIPFVAYRVSPFGSLAGETMEN